MAPATVDRAGSGAPTIVSFGPKVRLVVEPGITADVLVAIDRLTTDLVFGYALLLGAAELWRRR